MNTTARKNSLSQDIALYVRYYVTGRWLLVGAGAIVAIAALWFGWPLLVAAGIAPILIAFGPCALMCGAGLCMAKACKKSDAQAPSAAPSLNRSSPADDAPEAVGAQYAQHDHSRAGAEVPTHQR